MLFHSDASSLCYLYVTEHETFIQIKRKQPLFLVIFIHLVSLSLKYVYYFLRSKWKACQTPASTAIVCSTLYDRWNDKGRLVPYRPYSKRIVTLIFSSLNSTTSFCFQLLLEEFLTCYRILKNHYIFKLISFNWKYLLWLLGSTPAQRVYNLFEQ